MALTMTRTRTQQALTDLSKMVGNVHGELEFVEWALQFRKKGRDVLTARHEQLLLERDALYTTLHVFGSDQPPSEIRCLTQWLRPFGRKPSPAAVGRYIRFHGAAACLAADSTSALPERQLDRA